MHLSWFYTAEAALVSPLEEIREQEEMNVSAEGQVAAVEEEEDDSSLNLSADISLDSGRAGTSTPSQDSEILESRMARDNPSCDLFTDTEYVVLILYKSKSTTKTISYTSHKAFVYNAL